MAGILTVTLNPTIDLTTAVERLEPRKKLRCTPPRFDPGGGGLNVARVVTELEGDCTAFVALAGAEGQRLRGLLETAKIPLQIFEMSGETRLAFQVVEQANDVQYRFILPGPEQTAETADQLLDNLTAFVKSGAFELVVLSGSLPPGLGDDFYGRVAQDLVPLGVRTILDSSGAALTEALGHGLYLVKPDEEELDDMAAALDIKAEGAEDKARRLLERSAADVIVVTLGPDGVVLVTEEGTSRIGAPEVEVRSTSGAGDSFVGALVHALSMGKSVPEACRFGAAAGAAAVTTEATELAHRSDIDRLYRELI